MSIVLVFQAVPPGGTSWPQLFAVLLDLSRFSSGSDVFGDPIQLTTEAKGLSLTPKVAWHEEMMGIVWADERAGGKKVFFIRLSKDGVIASDELDLSGNREGGEWWDMNPSIAGSGSDSAFSVVWWSHLKDSSESKIYYNSVGCR